MPRIFVVIPAAGHSRRMGQPKLLLPFGSGTVISILLETLTTSGAFESIVLVARADDDDVAEAALRGGAHVIQPDFDPPEMRDSVEVALDEIAVRFQPDPADSWALIPGDCPLLRRETLSEILKRWNVSSADVLIPTYRGRGGHPTLFRWPLVERVQQIPPGQGLDVLLKSPQTNVERVELDAPEIRLDLDTPADYETALRMWAADSV